jgi:hypothetical protein
MGDLAGRKPALAQCYDEWLWENDAWAKGALLFFGAWL